MGIDVLPPDVNESYLEFGVVPETGMIRFGLSAIKNVGTGAIDSILKAREAGGRFEVVEDFARRVNASEVNKKVWESLIKSGAMDSLGERGELLNNLDSIVSYAAKAQKNALSGQIDIFGSMGAEEAVPALYLEPPAEPISGRDKLGWEKELLGLYLSRHPLDDYSGLLAQKATPIASVTKELENRPATIGGIITGVRRIVTKNQAAMAFVALEDKSGNLELVVFPRAFEATPELWQADNVVLVTGKVSTRDRDGRQTDEIKIMVDKAELIDYEEAKKYPPVELPTGPAIEDEAEPAELAPEPDQVLIIKLPSLADTTLLLQLKDLLGRYPGNQEVYVLAGTNGGTQKIKLPFTVAADQKLLAATGQLVGEEAVSLGSTAPVN